MAYGYTIKELKENMVKALASEANISLKQALEVCNLIRGKKLSAAKIMLQDVIDMKAPVPFKRFTNGLGHKRGRCAAGRYPIKACKGILSLLNSAEANGLYKGLSPKDLIISHLSVKQAPQSWHYGRQRRIKMKKCHIEVILEEVKKAETEKKEKTSIKTNSFNKIKDIKDVSKTKDTNEENNSPVADSAENTTEVKLQPKQKNKEQGENASIKNEKSENTGSVGKKDIQTPNKPESLNN
jgi:large subunit ribosomal protein L22